MNKEILEIFNLVMVFSLNDSYEKVYIHIDLCILSFEVQSRTDWIKKDLCIEEEKTSARMLEKTFTDIIIMKKNLLLGKIVGVVHIKRGQR